MPTHESDLTDEQILLQCKMYIAAVRIADDFGCDTIGIQYQQGLKDLLPASDLVEGTLNNADRPPVRSRDGLRVLFEGEPLRTFQRSRRVCRARCVDDLSRAPGDRASRSKPRCTTSAGAMSIAPAPATTTCGSFSSAAPLRRRHFIGGWAGAEGFRQPAMYFPNGGGTLRGISRPGEIVWSRIYVEDDELKMDIGRGRVVELPREETERRWQATTPQWPIMHAVLDGVSRDSDGQAQEQSHSGRLRHRLSGRRLHTLCKGGVCVCTRN